MTRTLNFLRNSARDPAVREFVLWCLPALLAGVVVRALLMVHLPYAFFHDDSPDFLTTPDSLLFKHRWELHGKKTFLVPLLLCVPFLLHLKAAFFVPLAQHVLGLGSILLAGLLCRVWFVFWRWFILPITLIVALDPFPLWYEHSYMAEPVYLFCTALLALAGTLYTFERSQRRFAFLCVALVLEAGARPEGKLLFGFGLFLLVLLHAREWRLVWRRFAVLGVLAIGLHFITKTSQAGLLLYTSVARFTPTALKGAPGFDPYIAPIRASLQQKWIDRESFPKVIDRGLVADAVKQYLVENPGLMVVTRHRSVNQFCTTLALETCRRNLMQLPALVYFKFRRTATEMPSLLFDNDTLFRTQREAYFGSLPRVLRMSKLLLGQTISDGAMLDKFMGSHYGEVPWFNALANDWLKTVNAWRLPDRQSRFDGLTLKRPGVPCYFILGGFGVVAIMWRRGQLQPFHIAWGLSLLGLFFVIILTANLKPRFRIVFEPFWFLYIGLLFDFGASVIFRRWTRPRASTLRSTPQPAEVPA